ncbi:MAG: penicillin-binding transpeptidase domain-containing protein [Firmicutes bacterium]|nr:penicillin-binding transpeptidase domain-containing protein [Bacillota bacterium]
MNRVVGRAASLLILILILAGGTLFFVGEYFVCSEGWVMSPGSPHVYNDGSGSGLITDRNGILLLDTTDGRVYCENEVLRKSIIHWLGDRQGNISAPILSHYADQMAGFDVIGGVYDYGETGGQITLTLSARVQMAALKAMGDYKGTVAVYNYRTGEILCAISTPTFDPDNLPDIAGDTTGAWDGAYVNRFLKSAYTPGSIFKIVTAAAALETIPDILEQTFVCEGEMIYDEAAGDKVTCLGVHGEISFRDAFLHSCNCAFAQIAGQLGGEVLQRYAQQFGVTESLSFDGITTASGNIQAAGEADVMVAWSAIGQHKDLINPCRFLTFVGTIANGGTGVEPYVVSHISGGSWETHTAQSVSTGRLMSSETAATLRDMMRDNVESYYGDENFPGLTVCAKSGTAEVGGGKNPNAMFAGFVADEQYPLAFIVAIENGESGRKTCIPVLSEVLAACKEAMDAE